MPRYLSLWVDESGQLSMLGPRDFRQTPLPERADADFARIAQNPAGIELKAVLPEPVWRRLLESDFDTLLLGQNLPEAWQVFPWEQLTERGQRLDERFQVIRYATVLDAPQETIQGTLCWHQWPDADFGWLEDQPNVELIRQLKQITRSVQSGEDLGRYARLVILAHGGERLDFPLKDRDDNDWPIQWPKTLPPEVWIVACASDQGNMHPLAIDCLQHGAARVVCGHGRLDARLIGAILKARLEQPETPLNHFLEEQRKAQSRHPGSVHQLRYYGEAPLDRYERMTLAFYQQPDRPNPTLGLLAVKDDEALRLLTEIRTHPERWSPLTLSWLLPCALYLAEKQQHGLLPELQSRYRQLPPVHEDLVAECNYALASAHRRVGHYPKAMAALADGLAHTRHDAQKIQLLGALLNDLIDLALPESGQQILDELKRLLSRTDHSEQAFRLLDRHARLALRQGNADVAVMVLSEKRRLAEQRGDDGHRELAALLYVTAWAKNDKAAIYAESALSALESRPSNEANGGNDDRAYLLRALAVYEWRFGIENQIPEGWLQQCRDRLDTPQDKGPWASVLLYRQLSQRAFQHQDWKIAVAALEQGQYWLELAAFHALAHQPEKTISRVLDQCQRLRADAIESLSLPPDIVSNFAGHEEVQERMQLERGPLLSSATTAESLLEKGLLPL